MFNLKPDLQTLYASHNIDICPEYLSVLDQHLLSNLSYISPLMHGLIKTICQSPLMIAYHFMHNAVDKATGAARIDIIAQKYASGNLREQMLAHSQQESTHSQIFAQLIPATGYDFEKKLTEDILDEVAEIYDYDDNLIDFIFRLHATEIRSWILLRHFLLILSDSAESPEKQRFQQDISLILRDEITHICYTAQATSQYIAKDPNRAIQFHKCLEYINKESWQDISHMSLYMAEHHNDIRATIDDKDHAAA